MSSSNQRPANRGFRSVLRCAISHYRQVPWLSAPEPPASSGAVERLNPSDRARDHRRCREDHRDVAVGVPDARRTDLYRARDREDVACAVGNSSTCRPRWRARNEHLPGSKLLPQVGPVVGAPRNLSPRPLTFAPGPRRAGHRHPLRAPSDTVIFRLLSGWGAKRR